MFTIIGGDGKEYGPVTLEKVREWIAAGRANQETKARREGETEWRALGEFPEFGAGIEPTAAANATPPPVAGPVDAKAFADDLIARAAPLDVFECLGRSFRLWTGNFFPLVGVTLLVLVVQMALSMIPILGMLVGLCLNGVFYGGLYYFYLGKLRGQPREVGDAFAGFSKAFVPLMLATLLSALITAGIVLLFAGVWLVPMFASAIMHGTPPAIGPGMIAAGVVGGLILIYISVAWAFSFVLVIDRGLGPWTAMEVSRRVVSHQWFRVFFVMLLGGILAVMGIVGLFIGVFFTLPLMFGAVICAYEDLCNPPRLG